MSSASHAVPSSLSGSPGTPALRPAATMLTAKRSAPYCWQTARNFVVRLTDGNSLVPEGLLGACGGPRSLSR